MIEIISAGLTVSLPTSSEPNYTPLARILTELTSLCILLHLFCCWPQLQASGRINNMAKYAYFSNVGAREMGFGSFDGKYDGKHNGFALTKT